MTRKLEFRVMPSSITGSWDVMARVVPASANRTPNWSLVTTARDASEIGEAILEEVEFRTVSPEFLHFQTGSSTVSCRLVPTEVAQDQVDWRVMALRVKHENAGPECFCENPKPGAHAQSCPRFGMNP